MASTDIRREHQLVWIDEANPEYSRSIQPVAAALAGRTLMPLLGAGISRSPPSFLPLAPDLMRPLRRALWGAILPCARRLRDPAFGRAVARRVVVDARLERLLAVLQETHGRAAIERYLSVLDGRHWNRNHAAVAAFAESSYLPLCVTLNFDLLIEEAVKAHDSACVTVCPLAGENGKEFRSGSGEPLIRILKPHGSLTPDDYPHGRFALLAVTLEEIGNRPDPRNIAALSAALSECPVLFVAGYSDNDWDIFPIVQRLAAKVKHVHWVHYASDRDVADRTTPCESTLRRVVDGLSASGVEATHYVGNPARLLRRTAAELGVTPREPDARETQTAEVTGSFFMGTNSDDPARARTAVSMAMLLQDRGRFNDRLAAWLHTLPAVRADRHLGALVHRIQAHTEHTRRNLPAAMRHMRRAVSLRSAESGRGRRRIADDLVWLGYEHFCLAKRPTLRAPLSFLLAPCHVRRGHRIMVRGLRATERTDLRERLRLRGLVRYYHVELRHAWAENLLLGGPLLRPITRRVFRRISQRYERLKLLHPSLMEWEYYWLRHLEARILAGDVRADEHDGIKLRIKEIERAYSMLQDHVQEGNTRVYLALLQWQDAANLLDEAESIWSGTDGVAASGLLRVLFYRRFLGVPGLLRSIRQLIRARKR